MTKAKTAFEGADEEQYDNQFYQSAADVPMVKLRVWNVVLEKLTPGRLTLRHGMRLDKLLTQGQVVHTP